MTSNEHKKHADIPRTDIGNFGRTELGLIGAPCSVIRSFVEKIADGLPPNLSITYVDADHQAAAKNSITNVTDRIAFHSIAYDHRLNEFDLRILLSGSDLLLINGNHFKARKQIVFCTEKKKESLQRKLDRLTEVVLIVLDRDINEPHAFLAEHLSDRQAVPILKIDQLEEIVNWTSAFYKNQIPSIKGLVLAGGKSQRMGTDKAFLNYSGEPQVYEACNYIQQLGIEPKISCRPDQVGLFNDRYVLVQDTFKGLGPFGAILTAFQSDPDSAWLVIACDQPLLTKDHLQPLIASRNPGKVATCYHNPETNFPEPLITLWEPRAYPRLLSFLSMGYSCPRKVLINSDIEEIRIADTAFMKNANTPKEKEQLERYLQKTSSDHSL